METFVVRRYNSDRMLQSGLRQMAKRGYQPRSINGRKAVLGFLAGPFTHKQVHTVVYEPQPTVLQSELERFQEGALALGWATPEEVAQTMAELTA